MFLFCFVFLGLPKCREPSEIQHLDWCTDNNLRESILNGTHVRHRLPVTGEKTIARFISEMEKEGNAWVSTKPCFVVPRVLIGPEESSPETVRKYAVDGLDPMTYHTLRYRKFKSKILPYTGKCLIDASRYTGSPIVANPHKILPRYCIGDPRQSIASALFKVHHYTGSFETFITHRGNNNNISEGIKVSTFFFGVPPKQKNSSILVSCFPTTPPPVFPPPPSFLSFPDHTHDDTTTDVARKGYLGTWWCR